MEPFETIYNQYRPMMYSLLRKLYIEKDQEDFLQIASLALWEAYRTFDEQKGKFSMYAFMKMKYAMLKELYRYRDRETKENQQEIMDMTQLSYETSFESTVLTKQLLLHLSELDRDILLQYYIYGLTYEEIGNKTGNSVEAIRKRKERALLKLQKKYKDKIKAKSNL